MLSNSNLEEPDTSRYFRRTFVEKFEQFIHESKMLSKGNAEFTNTWKDILGKEGLGVSVAVIVGIIAILGAAAVISAPATAGASLLVAVVGIGAGVAFYKSRAHIKRKRYQRAAEMLDGENISEDVQTIANLLADLYKMQLGNCTMKDANVLAEACVKGLTETILKEKGFNLDKLLYTSSLQGVLMGSLSRVPKVSLDLNVMTRKKLNMHGLISHSAFYCKETDEFYRSKVSKSNKYGVLFFDKKTDLDDYEAILTSSMRNGEQWKFSKMRSHEVNVMKRSSLFRAFDNDEIFERDSEKIDSDDGMNMR